MIKVDKLTRKYGEVTAVDSVSFEIGKGEIVGLLGHNGAGKTTIMKMLTGYLEPTAGTITIDDLDVGTRLRDIQHKIGYLPENCPVYPELTVIDYLDFSAALYNIDPDTRLDLIAEVLGRTGLQRKGKELISTLSRGYRQRTGVAKAILHKPKLLILDEPTNGLDPTQINHMRGLIRELAETSTVIISTHILQEVQAICDRVIIMNDGQLVLDQSIEELQAVGRLVVGIEDTSNEAKSLLESIDFIKEVQQLTGVGSSHKYRVTLNENIDVQSAAIKISDTINGKALPLYLLQPEARNLETVFAEMSAPQPAGGLLANG